MSAATLTASSVTLGSTSEGDAMVQSGGTITTAGKLTVGDSADGSLSVNASGSFNANALTVGSGSGGGVLSTLYSGSVTINNGSGNITSQTIVADAAGSLQQYGGSLALDNGAQFTTAGLVVGNQSGSVGQVSVSGVSSLTSTQNIVIGEQGTGSLSVDSSGSSLTSNGAMIVADAATPPSGQPAGGSLSISGGAKAMTAGLTIGNQSGSVGSVIVTGLGSSLTSTQNVIVGASGTGNLEVSNEATVAVTNGAGTIVAMNPGSNGSMISVSGAGSVFAAGNSLTLGQAPAISPLVDITYGGLLQVGSPTAGLGAGGGLAMGSNATLSLAISPGQTVPDVLTTGALDLGGIIQLTASSTIFPSPNGFIPLLQGNSIDLVSGLPNGVPSAPGITTSPTTSVYTFTDQQGGLVSVMVPKLTPLSNGTPDWLVPEVLQTNGTEYFGVQEVTPMTLLTAQQKQNDANLSAVSNALGQALGIYTFTESTGVVDAVGGYLGLFAGSPGAAALFSQQVLGNAGLFLASSGAGFTCVVGGPVGCFLGVSAALATLGGVIYSDLAADPYDSDYRQVFVPPTIPPSPTPLTETCSSLDATAGATPSVLAQQDADLYALYVTSNRYQSALSAGDSASATLQAATFQSYLTPLAGAEQSTGADLSCLSDELGSAGIGAQLLTAQEESDALADLETQSLAPLEEVFDGLGFTDAEIEELLAAAETDPPSLPTETLDQSLDDAAESLGQSTSVPEPGSRLLFVSGLIGFVVSSMARHTRPRA